VHFYDRAILHCNVLLHVCATNCDIIILTKMILTITLRYTRLADARVAKQHYFCFDYSLSLYRVFFVVLEALWSAAATTTLALPGLSGCSAHFEYLIPLKLGLALFRSTASYTFLWFLIIEFATVISF